RVPEYFWTHLLDVLLWCGLAQAREAVIAAVAEQLVDGLVTAIDSGARAHIVAHSLGTSVVHDTLLCLTDPKYASGQLDPEDRGDAALRAADAEDRRGVHDAPGRARGQPGQHAARHRQGGARGGARTRRPAEAGVSRRPRRARALGAALALAACAAPGRDPA